MPKKILALEPAQGLLLEAPETRRLGQWAKIILPHPAALLLPEPTPEEFQAEVESIKRDGLWQKVTLWRALHKDGNPIQPVQDFVLDGLSRLNAVEVARGEPLTELDPESGFFRGIPFQRGQSEGFDERTLEIRDPYEFVLAQNLARRHLSLDKQFALRAQVLKAKEAAKVSKDPRDRPENLSVTADRQRRKETLGLLVHTSVNKSPRTHHTTGQPKGRPPGVRAKLIKQAKVLGVSRGSVDRGLALSKTPNGKPPIAAATRPLSPDKIVCPLCHRGKLAPDTGQLIRFLEWQQTVDVKEFEN